MSSAGLRFLFIFSFSFAIGSEASSSTEKSSCVAIQVPRYFDGQKMFRKGPYFVVVEKDRIKTISSRKNEHVKSCSQVILDGATLSPGLIDSHVHLFIEDKTYGKNFESELLKKYNLDRSLRMNAAKRRARSMLQSGFTSVRDLGNSGRFLDLEFKRKIAKGQIVGPRLFVSGPGFVVGEGQFHKGTPKKLVDQEYEVVKSLSDAIAKIRKLKSKGVDWVKLYADNDPNPGEMSKKWLKQLTQAAQAEGLPVAIHTTSKASAERAVEVEPTSLEHVYQVNEATLKMMAEKGVFLVATDFDASICRIIHKNNPDPYYDCASYGKRRKERLTAALKAGAPISFGSDMYLDLKGHGIDRGEGAILSFLSLIEHGLSAQEALTAATYNNGKLLGRKDLGVIAPGAKADLVGFAGDPLQKIQNFKKVVFVMKGGDQIKDEN